MELVTALLQFLFLFSLVVALAWLTTRFVGTRVGATMRGSSLRVIQHIPAGRDRSIMLLEAGGRVYLLGITAHQVTLLDAIEDPSVIGRILERAPAPGENPLQQILPSSFADVLKKVAGRPHSGSSAAQESLPNSAEIGRLQEQIERLRQIQNK